MKTLVIATHQDDESLSCGCLIYSRVIGGHQVKVLSIYGRVYDYGRQNTDSTFELECSDFRRAQQILGFQTYECHNLNEGEPSQVGYYKVLEIIEKELKAFEPDEVIVPSFHDLNQDHVFLNHACRIALRAGNLPFKPFRVLEAFAFDRKSTHPNWFLSHSQKAMGIKIEAVNSYRREAREYPHVRSPLKIRAQHEVWGGMAGVGLAEGYNLLMFRE
jgi:LmbE family N-acetylglucosaminyl deacetylase